METAERRQIPLHDQPGFSPFALDCITLTRMRHPARHPERRAVLRGEPPRPRSCRTGPARSLRNAGAEPPVRRCRPAREGLRGSAARPPSPRAAARGAPAVGPATRCCLRLPQPGPRPPPGSRRDRPAPLPPRAAGGRRYCGIGRSAGLRAGSGGRAASACCWAAGPLREGRGRSAGLRRWTEAAGGCRPGAEVSACCLLLSSSSLRRLREERFPLVRFQSEKGLLRGEGIDVILKRTAVMLLGDGRDGRHREVGIFCWLQKKNRKGRAAAATAKMTFSRDAGLLSALFQLQPFPLNSGIALPSPDPETSVRAAPSRRAALPIPFGCAFGERTLSTRLCSRGCATSGCWGSAASPAAAAACCEGALLRPRSCV